MNGSLICPVCSKSLATKDYKAKNREQIYCGMCKSNFLININLERIVSPEFKNFLYELNELLSYFANRDIEIMMEESGEFQTSKEDFIARWSPQ